MNNEQVSGDQLIQLQNFAYLKQFMNRISVKVLMVASFLQVVMIVVSCFVMNGKINALIYNMLEFMGVSESEIESTQNGLDIFGAFMGVSGVIAIAVGLILPVTLLIITLRANNDDPAVVPKGAVQFLHVLSIIQFVFSIIVAVIGLIGAVSTVASSQNNTDGTNPVLSAVFLVIVCVISCLYYYYQTKFLSSLKLSCNGYSLISAGAKGFGVCAVIFAIANGFVFILMAIVFIVFSSFSSTTQLGDGNAEWQLLVQLGFMDFMLPIFAIITIIYLINMVVQIAMAMTAFSYKNTVTEAVRASYAVASNNPYNRANATANSPFKTYGGGNAYGNYNYSTSNSSGQQGYQHSAGNNSAPTIAVEEKPKVPDFSQQSQPNNNYGGGSFPQDSNNYGGGSFPQDSNNYEESSFLQNNNYYGENSFQQDNNYEENSFLHNNEYFASDNTDDQSYNSNDNMPSNSSFFN